MQTESAKRWSSRGLAVLTFSAIYLYAYPAATIFYAVVDLLHAAVGIILTFFVIVYLARLISAATFLARVGWICLAAGGILGVVLIKIGTPFHLRPWLYTHITLCVLGTLFLFTSWCVSKGWFGQNIIQQGMGFAALALLMAGIAAGAWWAREVVWDRSNRIANPLMPPETMDGEG